MSFILDALKKSEAERRRQTSPGFVDVGAAKTRARLPVWGLALAILLGINLIVLLIVLARGASTREAAKAAPAAAPPAHFSPTDTPPVDAPEIPLAQTAAAPAPLEPATLTPAAPPRPMPRAEQRAEPRLSVASRPKAEPKEVLPTLDEVNQKTPQRIPDLHLDIHVFASKPADRFVFINGRKYREGEALQEGPKVERITRDGVDLSDDGLRFSVPRQ